MAKRTCYLRDLEAAKVGDGGRGRSGGPRAGSEAPALRNSRRPLYKGRYLSEWVVVIGCDHFGYTSKEYWEAEAAVTQAGSNAIPYLIQWIQQ